MDDTIIVTIDRGNNDVKMIFSFDKNIELNLSTEDINTVQKFFMDILNEMIQKQTCFNFELDDKIDDLYHDVCNKYINNLNIEMKKIYKEIPKRDSDFV